MWQVWGEDMLLASTHLQRKWCARAMNYLEVHTLSRDQLLSLAENFPASAKRIRRAVVLLALRRHLMVYYHQWKANQKSLESEGAPSCPPKLRRESTFAVALDVASTSSLSAGDLSRRQDAITSRTQAEGGKFTGTGSSARASHEIIEGISDGIREELHTIVNAEMTTVRNELGELKGMLAQLLARGAT